MGERAPGSAGPDTPGGRIAAYDGLRGAAALLVVLAHYFGEVPGGLSVLTVGWLGVGLFFVLSGLLIGGIILDQRDEPGFFASFYLRRAARILPPYMITLAFCFSAQWAFADRSWADPPLPPWVYLAFGQNVAIPLQGEVGSAWLLPTWTLAVEEQFYLLLPALIVFCPKRWLAPALLALWGAATLFRLAIHDANPLGALMLLPSRMDLLLAGVLAAVALRRFDLRPHLLALRGTPLIAALGLLGLALARDTALFANLAPMILSVGAAGYLLAIALDAPEARRFQGPALHFLGLISYGLYLYHQPIAGFLHGVILDGRPNLLSTPAIGVTLLSLAVSIGAAYASWRFVEGPLLRLARPHAARFRSRSIDEPAGTRRGLSLHSTGGNAQPRG